MTIKKAADVIRQSETEPPADVVDELLEGAQSGDDLLELIDALRASPRPWAARVITLAAIRLARTDGATSAQLSSIALDLMQVVLPVGDWSAAAGCLDLLGWLVEDDILVPRDGVDRDVILNLLWQSLSDEHPNARSSAVHALEVVSDFGDISRLLGDAGVAELRRRIEAASSTRVTDVAESLASAEGLLPEQRSDS